MGFAGNLRTLSLVEVFQTIARINATGVLRLAADARGRDVVFDQGRIIGVAFRSGEQRQALLKRLIATGKLDAQSAASLSSTGGESQVVKAIVEQGWVSADDVSEAYEQQARDELMSLATWDYADFVFEDAGPGQDLANGLVERYRAHPITIDMVNLLMESARRADEWGRIKARIADSSAVFAPAADGAFALGEMAKEYPASAVVPLIDGVRSIDEIERESVASRFDVWSTLEEALERRLLIQLTAEEMVANAEHLVAIGEHARAAKLYRLLLAREPSSVAYGASLAACLEHCGDSAEAADCWSQLALQRLEGGEPEMAIEAASNAVRLAAASPTSRVALVRCLMAAGRQADAVQQLHALADAHAALGQLDQVRATCLKILAIVPGDEPARRQLARVFAHAEGDGVEDTVICVACSEVNDREAKACSKCGASLQLACLACGRVVGVSDRVCIFCGADPHAGRIDREPPARVGSTRFIRTDRVVPEKKGTGHWREKMAALLESARAKEAAGDLDGALIDWRELAKFQQDSSELQGRIRDLEVRIGQTFIEREIARGHTLRKGRHYWRALRCYRAALRSMPADDARAAPLKQIVASTVRLERRNTIVYAAAGLVVLALAWLVAQPHLALRSVRSQAEDARTQIARLDSEGGAAAADAEAAVGAVVAAAADLRGKPGETARLIGDEVRAELLAARALAARSEADAIGELLDAGDLDAAQARLATARTAFGDEIAWAVPGLEARVLRGRQTRLDRDLLVKEGPARLARAREREQAKALGEALALYRSLASSPDPEVSRAAAESAAQLEPQEAALQARIAAAAMLADRDLRGADAAYAALSADARPWGLDADLVERRRAVAGRLAAATAAFAALGQRPAVAELEAFAAAHRGSPEAEAAAARLATLRQQTASREQTLDKYRGLMRDKKWPEAWQAARDLHAAFGRDLRSDEVAYPLLIESAPAGAAVQVAGRTVGRTPFVLTWLPPGDGEVTVALDGWSPLTVRIAEAGRQWRLQAALMRATRWRAQLGKPVTALVTAGKGPVLALAGDTLSSLGADGAVAWSRRFAHADPLGGAGAMARRGPPAPLPGGGCALPLPERGVVLLDGEGRDAGEVATEGEVLGRPLVYVNDLLGPQARLALAAEALYAGVLGEPPQRLALPAAVLAGPVSVAHDLERLLAVVDLRGRLLGIDESTRAVAWELDLQASDCGQLAVAGDLVIALLDGARLAACAVSPTGGQLRWSQALGAPAAGDAVVTDGRVHVAAGAAVQRFGLDGAALKPLALPAPAACAPVVAGTRVAAACTDRTLHGFDGDRLAWSTPLPVAPTALAVHGDTLLVGLADGTVLAFAF